MKGLCIFLNYFVNPNYAYYAFYDKFQLKYFQVFFIFNYEVTIVHRGCSMIYAMTASTITPLFLKAVTLHVIKTILMHILTVLQTIVFFLFLFFLCSTFLKGSNSSCNQNNLNTYSYCTSNLYLFFSFSICVFFHGYSRTTELQGKGEGISSTPHNHFHPLRRNFRHKPGDDWRELTSPHK